MKGAASKVIMWLATGFGLGLSPVASGTVGSLPGVALVYLLALWQWSTPAQIALAVVLSLLAVPVCGHAEDVLGRKDDGRIVADEYFTFLICVLGIPWQEHPWFLAVAFVVNRVMDIVKPPPARQSQALAGGVGIVLDDVLACGYALAVNHALWWGLQRVL